MGRDVSCARIFLGELLPYFLEAFLCSSQVLRLNGFWKQAEAVVLETPFDMVSELAVNVEVLALLAVVSSIGNPVAAGFYRMWA